MKQALNEFKGKNNPCISLFHEIKSTVKFYTEPLLKFTFSMSQSHNIKIAATTFSNQSAKKSEINKPKK